MAVIINLKEIFATDSQVDVSNKVNFNFNQLIALGIGAAGPTGTTGPIGPAGPIGPIGPAGPIGSVIYGTTPATAATSAPAGVPSSIATGDVLITADKILKKVPTSGAYGWEVLTDFNTLVQTALGTNISPYVRLGALSRVVKPRVTAGLDLTNSVTSGDPNFVIPGLGTNYQTVLYNFDELKTSSLSLVSASIAATANSSSPVSFNASNSSVVSLPNNTITVSAGHGLTTGQFVTYSNEGGTSIGGLTNNDGYYVYAPSATVFSLCETAAYASAGTPVIDLTSLGNSGTPHKFITYPAAIDGIFPQTSNLSVYSFFNSTADAAKEFETNPASKGYRGQIELGSLDTLQTAYTGVAAQNFLISPSFENLRIRKYRLGGFSISGGSFANPGTYMLRAEYDLSSSGLEVPESFSPRRNSEHRWLINKAGTSQSVGRTVEMKLTNEHILANTEATAVGAGVSVDGLFFKRGASFGAGLAENYFGIGFNPSSNSSIDFDAPSGVTFNFNRNIVIGLSTLKTNGIDYAGVAGTNWTITAVNGNLKLETQNATATISLNNAIVVKADRLAQGIPFPVTQVASNDANTLDDYEEGTWTPVLYGGGFAEVAGNSFTAINNFNAIIDNVVGRISSYSQPVKTYYSSGSGYTESTNIYSGSTGNTSDRIIPIITHYSKYIKIGKLVKCWVNFTIDSTFNFLTGTYATNNGGSPTDTYTAGSFAARYTQLYNAQEAVNNEGTAWRRPAIGLTLPFPPEAAPADINLFSGSGLAVSPFTTGLEDAFSETQVVGKFHKAVDGGLGSNLAAPLNPRPVIISPLFADYPTRLSTTTGVFQNGGYLKYGPMNEAAIFPIQNSGHSELRLGRVPMNVSAGSAGQFTHLLKPAVLFYGSRLWDDSTYSTVSLCPVTALDCMYRSQVPDLALGAPNQLRIDAAIRFQCEFSYIANA